MAGAITVTSSSISRNILPLQRTLSSAKAPYYFISSSKFYSTVGSDLLRRSTSAPPSRKLAIRAGRTESTNVSLGFRPPYFELSEPLTGRVWKLDDFESHPALLDGPDLMAEDAKLLKYPFPYLYDETQDVARNFGAVCTPEFFLFKKDGRRPFELVYHGQFDDSRPGNGVPITGRDLSLAIDCVLSGQPVSSVQKRSLGCSIKWNPEVMA